MPVHDEFCLVLFQWSDILIDLFLSSSFISALNANIILITIAIFSYSIAFLFFLVYMRLSKPSFSYDLLEMQHMGLVISTWLKFRTALRKKSIKFVYPPTSSELERKTTERNAVQALLFVLFAYFGVFIYVKIFFNQWSWFHKSIVNQQFTIGDQLKALGSLTLAFEAILSGFQGFSGHISTRPLRPDERRASLQNHTRQYIFRFCGALALTIGYVWFFIPSINDKLVFSSITLIGIFLVLLLANGIAQSSAIFSAVLSGYSFIFSVLLVLVLSIEIHPLLLILTVLMCIPFHKLAISTERPIWYQDLLSRLGWINGTQRDSG